MRLIAIRSFLSLLLPNILVVLSHAQVDETHRFSVPTEPRLMQRASELNALHYPHAFTPCTLWDPWLPHATLWQAVGEPTSAAAQRHRYRHVFLTRRIDDEGYVSMQQHRGMAHSEGWPFPAYQQSTGKGWHFSVEQEAWAIQHFKLQAQRELGQWQIEGAEVVEFDPQQGMRFKCNEDEVCLTTPAFQCGTIVAPFVRVELSYKTVAPGAKSILRWRLKDQNDWDDERSVPFSLESSDRAMHFVNVPLYRKPGYGGLVNQYQWCLRGCAGTEVTLKSFITAVDTRHPITNANFVRGSVEYFLWTHDQAFLQQNILRMRRSLKFALDEFSVHQHQHVVVPWVGHDGRSGLKSGALPRERMRIGLGVGNNYWDLLPFGGHDFLASIYLYDAILKQAQVERWLERRADSGIESPATEFRADALIRLAESIKDRSQKFFWDESNGRFVGWKDLQGNTYDYGFTFVNLEAIYYGIASDEQARMIFAWLDGKREIRSDTSKGQDIYAWRFAPRATTRRNIETYAWVWNSPQSIPWGGQVQDGGAVLGFSYFDVMARLKTHGPDDAWKRLKEILVWFDEVQFAGDIVLIMLLPIVALCRVAARRVG